MLQVYTGNGKGKTTAALGLAFRAIGQNKRVFLIQFMKKGKDLGEIKAAQRLPGLKVLQTGQSPYPPLSSTKGRATCWIRKNRITLKDKQSAQKGLRIAQKAIIRNKYNIIILDELNVAVQFGLVTIAQVIKVLQNRPENLELIITGRDAHPELIAIADLVSEMKELKHYYRKGILAREGIEY